MSKSSKKIIREVAENFRKEDAKKEYSTKEAIDKDGNPKKYVIGTIRNVRNERFYRADVLKSGEKFGIPARRFRLSNFEDPKTRRKFATVEDTLRSTDDTSPYVSLTIDYNVAREFLIKRMEETGAKKGYIYEIIPETYLNTRKVLTRELDQTPAKEHGMNKNKEVLVAGLVKPEEIKKIHTIKIEDNPSYSQSREHQREVLTSQIKEEQKKLNTD
jgi:hypothetical protein